MLMTVCQSIDRHTTNYWDQCMSYIIPIPVWGVKQSNTGFICAVGRCVKFIVPININQMCVYKQIVRFVYINLFHFIYTLKNSIFNYKIFSNCINILFHFTSHHTINYTSKSNKQAYKPSMVCRRRVSGATKHRLHPSIYFNQKIKLKVRSSHRGFHSAVLCF